MNYLLGLLLASFVSQSIGTLDCPGDLVFKRCDSYVSENGFNNAKTCAYPNGDPNRLYDCKTEPVICICPEGTTLSEADGTECIEQCDTTPPVLTCPNIREPAPGNDFQKAVEFADAGCTDDSGSYTFTCNRETGSMFSIWETESVSCSCTDGSDNTADCTFTVEVFDETPPVAECPDSMTRTAPDESNSLSVDFDESPRCTDNSGAEITPLCDAADGSVFSIGEREVTCSCTDAADLEDSCKFTVTVVDETPPVAECPDSMTRTAPDESNSLSVDFDESPRCTDNSGAEITPLCDAADGSVFSIGEREVTCSCTDAADLEDSCKFTVTVVDETPPVAECPDSMTRTAPDESNSLSVDFDESPRCTDNSGAEITPLCDAADGSVFSIGEREVTCSCTDAADLEDSCKFTVTVVDETPPVAECPDSMTRTAPDESNSLSVDFDESPRCTDNSGAEITPLCDAADGSVFSIGEREVTCSCTDAADLEDSCKFTVTVVDETPPVAECPDSMTRTAPDESNSLSVDFDESPRCTDNSGAEITPLCDAADGSVFSIGEREVTCSCTDAADLEDSCKFTVTVVDETPPVAECPDSMTRTAPDESNSLSVDFDESPRCTDNSGAEITPLCDAADGSVFSIGEREVTCSCTDAADLEDSCKFTVTVTDETPPVAECPDSMTRTAPDESNSLSVDFDESPRCTDNSGAEITPLCDAADGSVFSIGEREVTCSCTDAADLEDSCKFTVTVVDETPPVAECPDSMTRTAPDESNSLSVDFDESPRCTDNSGAEITPLCDAADGSVFSIGEREVTCSCTDAADLEDSCKFTVTVTDETPPVAECPDSMTRTAPDVSDSLSVDFDESPQCTDNSGAEITPLCDVADGSVFSIGEREVTCSCTDAADLEDSCKFTVTVVDETPPVAECPDSMTREAPSTGNSLSVTFDQSPQCTDNSGAAITPLCDAADGSEFSIGEREVTCSCTDAADLEDSCKFTVTVTDETPPVAECPDSMTRTAPDESNSLSVDFDESPRCTDNSGAEITPLCDAADGSVFSIGEREVTCSCTDAADLEDSCKFTVTVTDETPPVAECPDSMTRTAPDVSDSLSVDFDESPRCTDNSGAEITPLCDVADGSVFSIGEREVTCSCTDAADLEDSCKFTVTVTDETPPVAECPDSMTREAPSTGNSLSVTFDQSPQCTDNSGAAITPLCDAADGSEFSIGEREVTCSCTDAADLEDSCKFTVTVTDETPPVAECPDSMTRTAPDVSDSLSVDFDESPRCTDNSGAEITPLCDVADGSVFSIGEREVTCSCTDAADLEDSCKFTVTVTDETPPVAECPDSMTREAPSTGNSLSVTFDQSPQCTDNSGAAITPLCDVADGSEFSIGEREVTCSCTDAADLEDSCKFTVTVTDETPPVAECPDSMTRTAPDESNSLSVDFDESPRCTDNSGAEITPLCDVADGSVFSIGEREVTCSCTDAADLEDSCKFTVTVTDETPPVAECPDSMTRTAPDVSDSLSVDFDESPRCTDNSGAEITPLCDVADGSVFSIGEREVTCSCTDAADLEDSCKFTVTVTDETPPVAECPDSMTREAPSTGNSLSVTFDQSPQCTDNSGAAITPLCDAADGSEFSIGEREVTCSCTDAADLEDSCKFTVTVTDVDEPVITCVNPSLKYVDLETYLAYVNWEEPTCVDNSGSVLQIYCDEDFGDRAIGTYTVSCYCIDESDNSATCDIIAEVDGVPHADCVQESDTSFFLDINDPNDPVEIRAKIKLPEVGTYSITVIATPTGETPGEELTCDYAVDVYENN
ncbi:hyalin-like isoform X4 [Apostichopus japonicus]|uniref:hyalin-like isoform X4 n=1 Tax=Stichopus japonicus TaxID=307972 RepID=UPI003AB7AD1C